MNKTAAPAPQGESVLPSFHGTSEFNRLLEKLPAGAYTCDPDGLITYFNTRAVSLWGREPKLNHPDDRFCGSFRLYSADGAPLRHDQCWMALALRRNEEFNGQELVIERPDGTRVTALAHANPIHTASGLVHGAVNVLVDISDRKRAEEALREADRYKDEFLATLAHELRNPLAPVRNAVEILNLQAPPTTEGQWAVGVIDRQMRQMTRLIDDLLDVSRITCNKLELRRERCDLEEIIRAAVETSRPLIDEAGHVLTVTVPPRPVAVDADATRLSQAVSNLLNNAAKYTQPGGRIWLTGERRAEQAVITVRDTGLGIPADMLMRVFDLFAQVERSLDRSRGGLGIGLTLVRRLVEMHGGTVEARSDGAGKGSVFTIRLAALAEEADHAAGAPHEGERASSSARLRILVVDDNRDAAASLEMLLRMIGNDVRAAHDGVEAVAVASEFRPHVVLLDIGLPKMHGYDAVRAMREQPWGADMVVIAVTGWGQDGDKERSKRSGFDHHLVKPVDPAELMRLIASLAGARRAGAIH